jgi:SAM-dependent methyltransferase
MATVTGNYHKVHLTPDVSRQIVWDAIVNYLTPHLPPAPDVLELAAAYCHFINTVKAKRKVAIDAWDEFPNYAHPDVECVVHDLRLPVPRDFREQFDVVLASNLLEHLMHDEDERLIEQAYSWLRPNGVLLVIQPNFYTAYRHYFDDYTHRTVWTHVSLAALMRSKGFDIVRIEPRFTPYSLKNRLPKWRWLITLYLSLPIRPFAGQMLLIGKKG